MVRSCGSNGFVICDPCCQKWSHHDCQGSLYADRCVLLSMWFYMANMFLCHSNVNSVRSILARSLQIFNGMGTERFHVRKSCGSMPHVRLCATLPEPAYDIHEQWWPVMCRWTCSRFLWGLDEKKSNHNNEIQGYRRQTPPKSSDLWQDNAWSRYRLMTLLCS